MRVRPAAVAGSFYPDDPAALRTAVEQALAQAAGGAAVGRAAKAVVAPHAGYAYSGPVAATAYARVLPLPGQVERVVLLGPAHTVPLRAVAASGADAFETPLGRARLDGAGRDDVVGAGLAEVDDRAHAAEHSLEVHLPFVQVIFGAVPVLPLIVGQVPPDRVAAVLERVWGGPETLVVLSTDLSHYHDHRTAQELDRRTAAAVLAKRPEQIGNRDACGAYPLRGLLETARRRDLQVELLELRTSADTAGDPRGVVGYGAFALC